VNHAETKEFVDSRLTWTDVLAAGPLLTVELLGETVVATEAEWRAWTGRRWRNGVEVHGPIYNLGTDVLFTGRRACGCATCSKTVDPQHKHN